MLLSDFWLKLPRCMLYVSFLDTFYCRRPPLKEAGACSWLHYVWSRYQIPDLVFFFFWSFCLNLRLGMYCRCDLSRYSWIFTFAQAYNQYTELRIHRLWRFKVLKKKLPKHYFHQHNQRRTYRARVCFLWSTECILMEEKTKLLVEGKTLWMGRQPGSIIVRIVVCEQR